MARKFTMPKDVTTKELVEGHPLGVSKIIQGDLREKTWMVEGTIHTSTNNDGTLLYDTGDKRNRPWFILAYESGARVVDD